MIDGVKTKQLKVNSDERGDLFVVVDPTARNRVRHAEKFHGFRFSRTRKSAATDGKRTRAPLKC